MQIKTIETRTEFDKAVQGGGKKLVLFYSSWCHFCLSFIPAFEQSAAAAPTIFLKVSVDKAPELESIFDIEVVPTVLCFNQGKLEKRLDGVLGRGLSEKDLAGFISCCNP